MLNHRNAGNELSARLGRVGDADDPMNPWQLLVPRISVIEIEFAWPELGR